MGPQRGHSRRATKRVLTDGLWVIILGTKGFVGLALFFLVMTLPAALFLWRFPARLWGTPQVAACSFGAVLLGLYTVDCLLNGFPNIIYATIAGGLIVMDPKQFAGDGGRGRR